MKDLTIALENRPGALAEMGAALGRAGVSIEGGGAWVVNGEAIAHFLFEDGTAAGGSGHPDSRGAGRARATAEPNGTGSTRKDLATDGRRGR
jgi:hypothetical protein